ncbi:hypothetical protein JN11_03182 [Mucilaginibacter frigoritolerans]|uniref:Tetratricopeptide repeat protein n=1 Tax=Mucilaginibacter frigoritolerans TaxID=652788 RepID=A0A562TXC4_9SPHI|nr:hypothetical protein [Mucilaginibacter frigoritolerans]TWI98103.1 hypothetical protein JN11_03182 [Mucilaginibacter frigoritolerans]
MKIAATLFIMLFACFKLSASTCSDTSKTVSSKNKTDSLRAFTDFKANQTYQLARTENHVYSVRLLAFNNLPDSLKFTGNKKLFAMTDNTESLRALLILSHADSLKLKQADSLRIVEAVHVDSVKKNIKVMGIDELKQQLKANKYELLKGPLYTEISLRYLNYDTLSNKKQKSLYQNEAISYTMLALHQYSIYDDTLGLRLCFDNLTKVYFAQKKYTQAKWFILQSNNLSRLKNDVPNIIASLITLSAIKSDIEDYTLAMSDLNEALQLSITHHYPKIESEVLKNYAMLYNRVKNYPKEAMMLKKRDSLNESIRRDERAKLIASMNAQAFIQKRKLDSLQKKKVYTYNIRKSYKNSSAKKITSL